MENAIGVVVETERKSQVPPRWDRSLNVNARHAAGRIDRLGEQLDIVMPGASGWNVV